MNDITFEVRAYPIDEPQGNTLAFASAAFKVDGEDLAAIRGIRVVDSEEKGPFVSMPQSKDRDGKYHDIAFPLTKELRDELSAAVLDETYKQASISPGDRNYEKSELDANDCISVEAVSLEIKVFPVKEPKNNTLAYASAGFNIGGEDIMAIRGIRIIDSKNGVFMSMPQSRDKDKIFRDVAFPLSGNLREKVKDAVLAAFDAVTPEKKKALGERLAEGAEKAAQYTANAPEKTAAKSQQTVWGA